MRNSPRRYSRPTFKLSGGPCRVFVLVTGRAGIRNLVDVGHRGRNKAKSVTPDVHIGDSLLNFRHVAGDTFIACASGLVMSMFFYCRRVRPVW